MSGRNAKMIRRASKGLEGNDDRYLKALWRATPAPQRRKLRALLRPGSVPQSILRCTATRRFSTLFSDREDDHRCTLRRSHNGAHEACGSRW